MRLESTRRLRGPNRYLSRPVHVSVVLLDELTEREAGPDVTERLLSALPGLAEHHCAKGRPGGFVERLREGTYFGHVTEHVAIELSQLVGRQVNFGRTSYAGAPGRYEIVVECPVDEPVRSTVPTRLLTLAMRIVEGETRFEAALDGIRATHEAERPGPSTAAIAAAARARDIPVERIGELSLLRLGHGRHRRLVWAAMTDATSAVGVDIAGDKQLTRDILDAAGVPVPAGGAARTLEEALSWYAELGAPVVVKPRSGCQGANVFLGVDSPAAVEVAYAAAVAGSPDGVVVERQLTGRDYRVLVVGGRVVAAAERVAAHVVGDGHTTVAGLVELANTDPRRGTGHDLPLTKLRIDAASLALLRRQDLDPSSVPAPGRTVWLRDNANLSTGGTSVDVTGEVSDDVAELCRRVAAIVGLDVAGIDLRLPDIGAPLTPYTGDSGVIEVNAAPGLRMHLSPTVGSPRDPGEAIVEALYPAGTPSRVPTVSITGTNGKTTTARLTAHLVAGAGLRVGLTTTDGVYIGGRLVQRADATGPRSAQVVLGDPTVDAAVLETARGGMLRQGLGYDRADVAVITNIAADHLGQDGIDDLDDLVDVKSLVAERVREGGAVVLNADCPVTRDLAPRLRGTRVVWTSLDPHNPLVREHWSGGGRAYVLADGGLVELADRRWNALLPVTELPGAYGGAARHAVANALAACAAARELGVTTPCLVERLRSFQPVAGRAQLVQLDGVDVLVDYAHNSAAIEAVGELVHRVWGPDRAVAVVTLPGDRRDDLLVDAGRAVAARFDRVVLYEDTDLRGRAPGEVPAIVASALGAAATTVRTVEEALPAALAMTRPGDVVLVLYERIGPVLALLDALGARPPAGDRCVDMSTVGITTPWSASIYSTAGTG